MKKVKSLGSLLLLLVLALVLTACSASTGPSTAVTGIDFHWAKGYDAQLPEAVTDLLEKEESLPQKPKAEIFSWYDKSPAVVNSIVALDKDYPLPLKDIIQKGENVDGNNYTYNFILKGAVKDGSAVDLVFVDPSIQTKAKTPAFVIAEIVGKAKYLKTYEELTGKKIKVAGTVSDLYNVGTDKKEYIGVGLKFVSFVAKENSKSIKN